MQLFALTPEGPQPLRTPESPEDATRIFDVLPLGVYEALRTFDHTRFVGLAAHIDRARRSMERMDLEGSLDGAALRAALHRLVTDSPDPEARVRFDVLAGPAIAYGSQERVLIQIVRLSLPPEEVYREGVRVPLTDAVRRERPDIKAAEWVVQRRRAYPIPGEGYDPILVDERGRLLEGVMSNLFLVREGRLWTAPTRGVLAGVTRGIVLELARELEVEAREDYVKRDELGAVEEAFFSTSVRSVLPVVEIGGTVIGSGRPGPITRRMMRAYADYCSREARPAVE